MPQIDHPESPSRRSFFERLPIVRKTLVSSRRPDSPPRTDPPARPEADHRAIHRTDRRTAS
jgi:hypothetical protein